jgi:hypothetical protein
MYRATCAIALLVLVVATGCTMCAHPFDYCGPTYTGDCGEQCIPNARAGSICSGYSGCSSCGHTVAAGEVNPQLQPIMAPQDSQSDYRNPRPATVRVDGKRR